MLRGRIPHPAALVSASVATGKRLQASDVDDAGARRRPGPGEDGYTADGVAAFRFPDGRVSTAYDMYRPDHPVEAEPGLVRVRYEKQYFPNETSGYRPDILQFRSLADLEAEKGPIDRTAAGMILRDDQAFGLVAENETEMDDILKDLPDDVAVHRGAIFHADIDAGGPINHVLMTWTPANSLEIHAATEPDALWRAAHERYSFLPAGEGLDGFLETVRAHGEKYGWAVAAGPREEMGAGVRFTVEDEGPEI